MSHQHSLRCSQCKRELVDGELYCYFCDIDLSKIKKEHGWDEKKYHYD